MIRPSLRSRFPTTFAQLAELMHGEFVRSSSGAVAHKGTQPLTGKTRLREDLRLAPRAIELLSVEIERAFDVAFGDSQVAGWKTLDDVCGAIANCRELEAA